MSIVLSVRPSLQIDLRYGRVHRPSMELALAALETTVLLYAPSDEAQHGYFGSASVTELNWDTLDPRFLILTLERVERFATPVSISTIQSFKSETDELAEDQPHHYAQGIRTMSADLFDQIIQLGHGSKLGISDPDQSAIHYENADDRQRRQRAELIRDQRLRLDVLFEHKFNCCLTGLRLSPLGGSRHEWEVCHIMPVRLGGPDILQNAFPAIRSVHWAFDYGLVTIRPNRTILFSADAPPDLKWLFRGRTHARFPEDPDARPKAEYLEFHFANVFRKGGV